MIEVVHRARYALWAVAAVGLLAASVVSGRQAEAAPPAVPLSAPVVATASQATDDEVVLPSRVENAIGRTQTALDRAEARVDDQQYGSAAASLQALAVDLGRAHTAGRKQLRAKTDPEAETTPGPDSVVAVLTAEQSAITGLAGLYDSVTDPVVLNRIGGALNTALAKRDKMLDAVIALNPEGAGAVYADTMADTVDGYADEVANLTEALKVDRLTTSARAALSNALSRSQAATAKVIAAFGGGE
jgi:hypothetical protein